MAGDTTDTVVRLKGKATPMLLGRTLLVSLGDRRVRLPGFSDADRELVRSLLDGVPADALLPLTADPRRAAFLHGLEAQGMLEDAAAPPPADLLPEDLARYDRLLHFFAEFEDGQRTRYDFLQRLLGARVALVGIGGMGSWVAYNLVCSGVGSLVLIDPDTVEASNLNRAILYTEDDVGRSKVEAASAAIRRFAPRVEVMGSTRRVTSAADVVAEAAGADLVLGLADQPLWLIRHWVAEAGRLLGTAVLQANGGSVGPFQLPAESSCTMCVWAAAVERHPGFPAVVEAQREMPRRTSGAVSAGPSFTSGVVAMEAIRYLAGYQPPRTVGATWEADLSTFTAAIRPRLRHPACPVCSLPNQPHPSAAVTGPVAVGEPAGRR